MKPELSILIINYNGKKYLKDCFDSIYSHTKNIDFEIIVLDNNSTDESGLFIKEKYPEITLIESKINFGFGKGNNEAAKHAKGDYLLLLNNDTILLDQLLPVLKTIKNDKSIGIVGINMLDGNNNYLPSFGNFPNFGNMFYMKNLQNLGSEFKTGRFSKPSYQVDWIGGAFMLLSKKLYNEIGGFDQDYFMYVEDVDLCQKIYKKGLKRVFLPNYSYIHFVGFSKNRNPMLIKGYQIYINKHLKGFQKAKCLLALKINKSVKTIKSFLQQ